jgi:hypothetical protein
MAKREADHQLTDQNYHHQHQDEEQGSFKQASQQELSTRKIKPLRGKTATTLLASLDQTPSKPQKQISPPKHQTPFKPVATTFGIQKNQKEIDYIENLNELNHSFLNEITLLLKSDKIINLELLCDDYKKFRHELSDGYNNSIILKTRDVEKKVESDYNFKGFGSKTSVQFGAPVDKPFGFSNASFGQKPMEVSSSGSSLNSSPKPVTAFSLGPEATSFNFSSAGFKQPAKSGWECGACMVNNKDGAAKCIACETPNPSAKPAVDVAPKFALQAAPSTGFNFSSAGFNPPKAEDKPTTGFSFGASKQAEAKASTGFSFGTPKPVEDKASTGFSFGTLKPAEDKTTTGISFGTPKPAEDKATTGFSFGTPKPVEDKASTGFSFGILKPPEDKTTTGFSFGTPKPAEDKATSGFSFGTPKPAEQKPFVFGAKPAEDKPTAGFSFGTPKSAEDKATTGFSFGTPKPAEQKPFVFGAKPAEDKPTTDAKPAFSFGTAANSSTGLQTPTSVTFGQPQTPAFQFGSAAPAGGDKPFIFSLGTPAPLTSTYQFQKPEPKEEEEGDAMPAEEQIGDSLLKGQGEENDKTLFEVKSKVYFQQTVDDKKIWDFKGTGFMKLNKSTESTRLLMRTDLGKVLLNSRLFKTMLLAKPGEKEITLGLIVEGVSQVILMRVGKKEDSTTLFGLIEKEKQALQ